MVGLIELWNEKKNVNKNNNKTKNQKNTTFCLFFCLFFENCLFNDDETSHFQTWHYGLIERITNQYLYDEHQNELRIIKHNAFLLFS